MGEATRGVSRRTLFGAGGLLALGGAAGAAAGYFGGTSAAGADHAVHAEAYRGDRQAGIISPAQDQLVMAAFNVTTTRRDELEALLREWSTAAEQMAAGELVGGEPEENPLAPPRDTGEAWGYDPAGLTITFGYGASLFIDAQGADRFGLKDRMPAVLAAGVPKFPKDALQADKSDGDIVIQICGNDAQVCVHALHNLARIGFGRAALRWSQVGYGRTSSTSKAQDTPRNLFGYKDGTNNIKSEDSAEELDRHLWIQPGDDPAAEWLAGGTYLVARRIRMRLEIWDRQTLADQDAFNGRSKRYGAPLSVANPRNEDEFVAPDFAAVGANGQPAIPRDAHIRIVHPSMNDGVRMLRRGYNFTDGNDSLGRLSAGLFFIAFVRDPRTQFYPVLLKMTQQDALTEYLQHQASGLYAIPPGLDRTGRFPGEKLFA